MQGCLLNGLRQGDCAYVHCMAGVHGAAVASAIMRCDLYGESWAAARDMIERVRNVDFPGAVEYDNSEWWAESWWRRAYSAACWGDATRR